VSREVYLTSDEITTWVGPYTCRVVEVVSGMAGRPALLVELSPPGPHGELQVVLQPRYEDESSPWPGGEHPIVVNIFEADLGAFGRRPIDVLIGVGDLYATAELAAASAVVRR